MQEYSILKLLALFSSISLTFAVYCRSDEVEYNNSCYYFSTNSLSMNEARSACWQRGYDIASIDDPSANRFVAEQALKRFSASHYLIGLYRTSPTSQYWYWYDGNWASYRNWDANQPTGMGTIAIVYRLTGNWSVNFDDFRLPFVCRSYWYNTDSTETTTSYYWRDGNEKKKE